MVTQSQCCSGAKVLVLSCFMPRGWGYFSMEACRSDNSVLEQEAAGKQVPQKV